MLLLATTVWGTHSPARACVVVSVRRGSSQLSTTTRSVRTPASINPDLTITYNGLMVRHDSATGVRTDYAFDALGRQIASQQGTKNQEPRTSSFTHYNAKGQVDYTADALTNKTTYTYDATTGRRIAVTDALSNTTYTAYDPEGRVLATEPDTCACASPVRLTGRFALPRWISRSLPYTGLPHPRTR